MFASNKGTQLESRMPSRKKTSARGQAKATKKVRIETWYEPKVDPVAKSRTGDTIAIIVVLGVSVCLAVGFTTGGGAGAAHVWMIAGPLLGTIFSHFFKHDFYQNKS